MGTTTTKTRQHRTPRIVILSALVALCLGIPQIFLGFQAPPLFPEDSQQHQFFRVHDPTMHFQIEKSNAKMLQDANKKNHLGKTTTNPRILLFLTTIFSSRHVDFFTCCWPQLMKGSNFLKSVHVMIFSNNETEIPEHILQSTKQLFIHNPSFQFQFATNDELQEIRQQTQKSIRFQMGANLGMKLGFSKEWFQQYDWIIRINPDVLIRNSTWLANVMLQSNTIIDNGNPIATTVNGIFAKCSETPQRIHTDFFAIRPQALRNDAFSQMVVQPHTTNLYNHEYTAYKEFLPLLQKGQARFLPDIAPSNGFCRLRGDHAPIYHGHESCRKYDKDHNEQPQICNALEGWPIT